MIEYNDLIDKAKLVQGDKNSENTKKILKALDKFVIVLDFDGVITSHSELKTKYINEFGYSITEKECGYDACVRKGDVKEEHYTQARLKTQTESPDKLPLTRNFLENLANLKKLENTNVFILTSRPDTMLGHLKSYLEHHKIKVEGIINTSNKNKSEYLKDLRPDIVVEDSPHKLREIFENLDKGNLEKSTFVLFRTMENSPEPNPHNTIIETDNWNDLYEIISRQHRNMFSNK